MKPSFSRTSTRLLLGGPSEPWDLEVLGAVEEQPRQGGAVSP